MKGIENLPLLKRLHLRANKIESLDDIPDLPALEYLNLRENQVATVAELPKLGKLYNLTALSMQGNPVADEKGDDFKKEILIKLESLRRLKKVGKDELTPEDREDAKNEKLERIRIAEEEAAAAAAAAAEKAAEGEGAEGEGAEGEGAEGEGGEGGDGA